MVSTAVFSLVDVTFSAVVSLASPMDAVVSSEVTLLVVNTNFTVCPVTPVSAVEVYVAPPVEVSVAPLPSFDVSVVDVVVVFAALA